MTITTSSKGVNDAIKHKIISALSYEKLFLHKLGVVVASLDDVTRSEFLEGYKTGCKVKGVKQDFEKWLAKAEMGKFPDQLSKKVMQDLVTNYMETRNTEL